MANEIMHTRTPGRQWLFRLIAAVLLPLLVLGALEIGLRLAGYGYRTTFFRPYRIGGEDYLVENEKIGLRFFPPQLVRSPQELRMHAKKPAGTFRIFVLGESAAMGDPEPAYGAWRYLEAMLRERYPKQSFEIINVSMTAINSHTILPIARECAGLDGDLWIIYMGNNEMVGPFGAVTVFGAKAPPLWMVRLGLSVQRTRVGQLAASAGLWLKGKRSFQSWEGMQMFTSAHVGPQDPKRQKVYENFRGNLTDILKAGLSSGTPIILNKVAVNLRDCPPFGSIESDQPKQKSQPADPYSAQNQYALARSALDHTNCAEARQHFALACDYDTLPFRADSRINGIIADAGYQFACPQLRLVNADEVLNTNSPCGAAGEESFYEHVHFNFDGNYRLARAWAAEIETMLGTKLKASASTAGNGEWASQELCERRLGLTDWNRSKVFQDMLTRYKRPPLSDQANNDSRAKEVRDAEKRLAQRMDAAGAAKARAEFEDAVSRAPDDYYLRQKYAAFLEEIRDQRGALAQWRDVKSLIPHNAASYFAIGKLLGSQGYIPEAEESLRTAATMRPEFGPTWLVLAQLDMNQSKMDLALQEIGQAKQISPKSPQVYFAYGRAYTKMGHSADAIASYRRAIELDPDFWQAHAELAGHLVEEGNTGESRTEFEQVIRLKPDFAMGHFNLGLALMKQGHPDDARAQFEETLRLDAGNQPARDRLAQLGVSGSRK
ncbi:MAG: tetratricopeptide repeat protein [Limisphaerales bacterium]